MARTMQDLSEGIFINMAYVTLAHRGSYLDYLRALIKQDILTALHNAPLHINSVFRPVACQGRGGDLTP